MLHPSYDLQTWTVLSKLFYPQFIGCLIMGWVTGGSLWLQQRSITLHVAVGSGLCGSITSFSSVVLNSTMVLIGLSITSGHAFSFYNFLLYATIVLSTLAVSFLGFRLELADSATKVKVERRKWTYGHFSWDEALMLAVAVAVWVAMIALAIAVPQAVRRDWIFALCFAPIGASIRYALSSYNPPVSVDTPRIPLGTLIVNLSGVVVLAVVHLLSNQLPVSSIFGTAACLVLNGIADGFCGCLTTVSTLVTEVLALPQPFSARYLSGSVIAGTIIVILVNGVGFWVGALTNVTCGTK
ncbi:hypothetical protein RI367_004495 [Sorochytrium milnesiophthora]